MAPIRKVVELINKYPLVIGAIVIYAYYLTATIDFFRKTNSGSLSLLDFILQFDSLIWMWLVAFVFVKLQQTREKAMTEERSRIVAESKIQRAALASSLLNEISAQLQDTINNPLAIIRVSTEEIRKKFSTEVDVLRRLDQIDSSLRRIHDAIKDVVVYQSTQMLEEFRQERT
jgi:signal transduction histidine kinase